MKIDQKVIELNQKDERVLRRMLNHLTEATKLYGNELSEDIKKYLIDNCSEFSIRGLSNFKGEITELLYDGRIIKYPFKKEE